MAVKVSEKVDEGALFDAVEVALIDNAATVVADDHHLENCSQELAHGFVPLLVADQWEQFVIDYAEAAKVVAMKAEIEPLTQVHNTSVVLAEVVPGPPDQADMVIDVACS